MPTMYEPTKSWRRPGDECEWRCPCGQRDGSAFTEFEMVKRKTYGFGLITCWNCKERTLELFAISKPDPMDP